MASTSFFNLLRITIIFTFVASNHVHSLSSSIVSDGTIRVDPLRHLRKYRDGYNITNKHYWSSTSFTGIYGYSVAILWIIVGVGFGVVRSLNLRCCTTSWGSITCRRHYFLFALSFTILSVVSACVALRGNAKLLSRERSIFDAIIGTADNASVTLDDAATAMKEIRDALHLSNSTFSISSAANVKLVSHFLSSTPEKLQEEADQIRKQTTHHRRMIDKGLKIAYIFTMITITLCLATSIILAVCGILSLRVAVNWLIGLCWIINAICWFLFGIYVFLYEFSNDSCTAMESFQKSPYNNSLSSIVPCDDLMEAQQILSEVSSGVYNLVNEVNKNLSVAYPDIVFHICNPFSGPPVYRYQQDHCSINTIKIGDIPRVLKGIGCSSSNRCGGTLLSASQVSIIEASARSVQSLLDLYPAMESLVDCQIVRDTFAKIVHRLCKPLRRDASIVRVSLAILSVIFMSVILLWALQSYHDPGRSSVNPQDSKLNLGLGHSTS